MTVISPLRSLSLLGHFAPLLMVVLTALLWRFGLQAGVLGLPILLVTGSWFLKYAFMLLDHVAEGRRDAPVLTAEAANPFGESRPLVYGLLIGSAYLAIGALGGLLGETAVSALRLLALLALPAVLATQVTTGSLAQALNVRTVFETVRDLGSAYLLVIAVAIACGSLAHSLVIDGAHLAFLVRAGLLMLLWLALFIVLGGAIHARRHELGFEPEHSPERTASRDASDLARSRDRFIDLVFAEYRAGHVDTAWRTIEDRANRSTDALAELHWIEARVAAWPNPRLANRIAQELLPRLLATRRTTEALRLVGARLQADPDFRPQSSDTLIALASLARASGNRPLARNLLADFGRHYPDDPARHVAQRLADQLDSSPRPVHQAR